MRKHNRIIILWAIYLAGTVLFYALFLAITAVPWLSLVGTQAPYYLLLLTMLLAETSWIPNSIPLLPILVGLVILFAVWFVVSSIVLLVNKKYRPFGLYTAASNFITLATMVTSFCVIGENTTVPMYMVFSIIGNACFTAVYCIVADVFNTKKRHRDNESHVTE